jgi:hypothetical protein
LYADPEQQHRASAQRVAHTINRNSSLFARYFYAVYDNSATWDSKNVLTLSRTGQNNPVHSLVLGHSRSLASTLNSCMTINRTLNDVRCRSFQRHRSRPGIASLPGYVGVNVTGNGFAVGNGATTPATSTPKGSRSPTTSIWSAARTSSRSAGLDPRARDAEQPPDQRRVHLQRPGTGLSLADFMLGS